MISHQIQEFISRLDVSDFLTEDEKRDIAAAIDEGDQNQLEILLGNHHGKNLMGVLIAPNA